MKIFKKKIFSDIIVIIFSILFIYFGNSIVPYESQNEDIETCSAKVLEIISVEDFEYDIGDTVISTQINFKGELKSGANKGQVLIMEQYIDGMYFPQPRKIEIGDNIIVSKIDNIDFGEREYYAYVGHNKIPIYIFLTVIFLGIILLIGKRKGFSTIISLIFTILSIFLVFIPAILFGKNIYLTTIIVSIFIIFMSLILINGINKKTFCAIFGNLGGIAISGILAFVFSKIMNITGVLDQDYAFLYFLENGVAIDLKAVVWAGILIGCLGAVMDVAMSIASSMNEFSETMEEKSYGKMVKSGMNVGKDAIGTMTNTLILAYVGSSLATILLFVSNNQNILFLLNLEMIAVDILKSIVGSMGILFAVPVTVLLAAKVFNGKNALKNIKTVENSVEFVENKRKDDEI